MAVAEASPVAIDYSKITIVICVVEEPVEAAACAGADELVSIDSNSKDAVSPDEGQPKEEFPAFMS